MSIDYAKLLQDRPDVLAQSNLLNKTADMNSPWAGQHGVTGNPQDFAAWWYNNGGGSGEYNQNTPAPVATPTGPTARDTALQRARLNAQLQVQGRGLNYADYSGDIEGYLNNIYSTISDTDTNPNAYFDPNIANTVLGGKENQLRNQYRGQVNQAFGNKHTDYSALDGVISKILGEETQSAEDMFQRGLKRGQFNDKGYAAGENALSTAKLKARSKLTSYAKSILDSHSGDDQAFRDRAYQAASGYTLGDTFDINQYLPNSDSQNSPDQYAGELYNMIGTDPLIDLGSLRNSAGTGQGALNLQNLDVLDGVNKRKQSSTAGRGLGSQGGF